MPICWGEPVYSPYTGSLHDHHNNVVTFFCHFCRNKILRCTADAMEGELLRPDKRFFAYGIGAGDNEPIGLVIRLYHNDCRDVARVAGEIKG